MADMIGIRAPEDPLKYCDAGDSQAERQILVIGALRSGVLEQSCMILIVQTLKQYPATFW